MPRSASAFGMITLLPVVFLALATTMGGVWIWVALVYLSVFTFTLDELIARFGANRANETVEFPAANALSIALALAHFGILALVLHAFGRSGFTGTVEKIALFQAAGLFFGQVSNANAHELIHKTSRREHGLGSAVFISLLFGHHTSAHRHVHHRYVASPQDPNTARRGEGFYRFAIRAWAGSFRAGWQAESRLRKAGGTGLHPYAIYVTGGLATVGMTLLLGGVAAVVALFALAGYAQMQLLLSDYVQHYGLTRARRPDGRLEPVGDRHSWNAPHWFSGRLTLNAPRHSDHHSHPARPFPDLVIKDDGCAPTLPYSLPAMSVLALFPRIWHRVMERRLQRFALV